MDHKKCCHIRLWITVIIAAGLLTIGAGSYRDLSAYNEETYKGLKIFSDVLEMIEKNYLTPNEQRLWSYIDDRDIVDSEQASQIFPEM
ncbi:MAG: hypothetical protein KKA35_07115, partial [Proteobacteria bacterium]|nr:hypothetical protein [Pseudomonadota bacterium]